MTKLYLAMEKELLIVDEQTEAVWSRLSGMQPVSLATDPFHPERIYCGTFGRGLWRSTDGGDTWEPVGDPGLSLKPVTGGITHPHVMAVAVSKAESRQDFGTVYAGTEPSGLFVSRDGGDTWREWRELRTLPSATSWSFPPRPHTHHVRWIAPAPEQAERIHISIEAGAVIRTLDNGHSWEDRKFGGPIDVHTLLTHHAAPQRLYAAAGDGFRNPGREYAESRDAGETWEPMSEGLEHHYLYGLAVDTVNPDLRLVSAAESPRHAHDPVDACSYIYRKEGDHPWERVDQGLPAPEGTVIPTLTAHPSQPGRFYALSNRGLCRSTDGGRSWVPVNIPWKEAYRWQHHHALLVVE
jgi:photosystem II stability/assembly factor-like uncharacterized protein